MFVTTFFETPTYGSQSRTTTKREIRREAKRYKEFLYLLGEHHVDRLDYHALTDRAIDGALSLCDPHSQHIPKQRVSTLREQIEGDPIEKCYMIDSTTLCLSIKLFSRNTSDDILSKYREMESPTTLVLDLRGNEGGLVVEAIKTSELFLSKGDTILTRKGRTIPTQSFVATSDGELHELELIVAIDRETASASEIVVGALKDQNRALIVGEDSFGKGLILKQCYLSDGSSVLIATSNYLTPNQIKIQRPYNGRIVDNSLGGIKPIVNYKFSEIIDNEEIKAIRKKSNEI